MKKRVLSFIMVLAMALSLCPVNVLAAAQDTTKSQVHVVVENTTYAKADGAPWDGTLVDTWVNLKSDSTVMSCVVDALTENGYKQSGAENNYISSINDLGEFDGGDMSGWMGTLNDWFTNEGFGAFTVENGKLTANDEIRIMYTCAYGEDLGSSWSSSSTALKDITFSAGKLDKTFDGKTLAYTLIVPEDVKTIKVLPTAENKNFQVHTKVGDKTYKRTEDVPVANGTEIVVVCGEGPSMNDEATPTSYKFTVKQEAEKKPVTATVNITGSLAGELICAPLKNVEVSSDLAEQYGYTDSVDLTKNVSALDCFVKIHEEVFGEAFTKATKTNYLNVSSSGFTSTLFGYSTYANGFMLNNAYPHDGTSSSWGGYNGTLVTTQAVKDGDLVEFFGYTDEDYYSDIYTWFETAEGYTREIDTYVDKDINLTLKGYGHMSLYLFKDTAEMVKSGQAVDYAQLYLVNMTTGETTPIKGALTQLGGKVKLNFSEPGDYTIVAKLADAYFDEDEDYEPLILSETLIHVKTKEVSIKMNTTSTTAKIYAAADTDKKTDLLAGLTPVNSEYKLGLKNGDYILEGIDKDGSTSNGTIKITITEDNREFQIWTVTAYASTTGFVYGTDYTIEELAVRSGGDKATVIRDIVMGDSSTAGRKTFLVLNGDTYEFYGVPTATKDTYTKTYKNGTVTASNYCTASFAMALKGGYEIKYPYADEDKDGENDYILESGQMSNYYIFTYFDPTEVKMSEDGTSVTASFESAQSGSYFYIVSNPKNANVVKYGNYLTAGKTVVTAEVTAEMLYANDSAYNNKTIIKNFSKNKYDVADIYLNINEKGYLNLNKGEKYNLYPYRNWLAIEGISNEKVIEPDFNVQVINVEGSPISVTKNTSNTASKNKYEISAEGKGTAIVLVTYDAMTNGAGMTGYTDENKKAIVGSIYSAIWPENTGVFVVTVDGNTGFDTGMTINEGLNTTATKLAGDYYDSELDILYYAGNDGASYTFTPAAGTSVSMAVSTIKDGVMTFGEFSTNGVKNNGDGSYTLSGLTEGKTIVKLTNAGKTEFQVLRSIHTDYSIYAGKIEQDASKNYIYDSSKLIYDSATGYTNDTLALKAGDAFTVKYTNVYHPANKLSGIYNMSASVKLTGEDGTAASGTANQYLFASTEACHLVTMTIPKYWSEASYNVTGAMFSTGFGSTYGMHRILTYEAGKTPNFTAASVPATFGQLPAIEIKLENTAFAASTISFFKENGTQIKSSLISKIELVDDKGVTVPVNEKFEFNALPGTTISYKVYAPGYEFKTGSFVVDEDCGDWYGAAIMLTASESKAWDGVSMTKPEQDEDGVYLISNGAELNWFQNETNANSQTAISAKLTANINLGKYPWTPIAKNGYTGIFDGNGYTIKNLYINASATAGLFSQTKKNGVVKNLTVEGEISAQTSTGGIVGYAYDGLVDNCISKVNITLDATNANYVGGIAGYAYYGTITNCSYYGKITNNGQTAVKHGFGGILGNMSNAAKVKDCVNNGYVEGLSSVGGIVGYTSGTYASNVENCVNNGKVVGNTYVGGIIGYSNGYSTRIANVSKCINNGDVEAIAASGIAGGVVGNAYQYTVFTDCANNGTVKAENGTAKGFVGTLTANKGVTFNSCYYVGEAGNDVNAYAVSKKISADDFAPAKEVIAAIAALGEIDINSTDKVDAVDDLLRALTPVQQEMVTNADVITAARNTIAQLVKEEEERIAAEEEARRQAEEEAKKEAEEKAKKLEEDLTKLYETSVKTMADLTADNKAYVGSIGGEWWVLGLARSEKASVRDGFYKEYKRTLAEYVKENILEGERLHRSKSTDNSRVILALTAIGENPTDIAGHNLVAGLNSMSYVTKQGLNGPVWALLALDSKGYEVVANDDEADAVTRDKLVDYILGKALANGGWTFSGTTPDTDMTAMAIQALAPYYTKRADVKAAIDKAVEVLSKIQADDGCYASWGTANSESADQVIVALTALGINPKTDERFIKNGHSLMESMIKFATEDGGFKHVESGKKDGMATEQGFYAMVAYNRFLEGKTSLYDMSDVKAAEKDAIEKVEAAVEVVEKPVADNASVEEKEQYVEAVIEMAQRYEALTETEKEVLSAEFKEQIAEAKEAAAVINHTDGNVTVDGIDWDIKVSADVMKTESEAATKIAESVDDNLEDGTILITYDVNLTDLVEGTKVEPGEAGVTITMVVPEAVKGYDHVIIAHLRADGVIEYVIPTIDNGLMTFKLSSLSPISVIGYNGEEVKENFVDDTKGKVLGEDFVNDDKNTDVLGEEFTNTGDASPIIPYLFIMLVCVVVSFTAIKKRENN